MSCCPHQTPAAAPPPPPTPGLLARAASLGSAVVQFAAGGFRPVSPADFAARMAVCDACPWQKPQGLCAACGCVLSIKARMPAEPCPQGKWPLLTS